MTVKNYYRELRKQGFGYDEAHEKLKQECIEKKQFSGFVTYLLNEYYSHTEYADSFLNVLIRENEYGIFKTYWKARLSEQIRYLWELVSYWKNEKDKKFTTKDFLSYDRKILDANQDKYPAYQDEYLSFIWYWYDTLDFIDRYIIEMQKINALEEIERAKALKESVYSLKKPKPKPTTDKRKKELLFGFKDATQRIQKE